MREVEGQGEVALRKESVDRNSKGMMVVVDGRLSLSARRAWIEIPAALARTASCTVALRKESVDRNMTIHLQDLQAECRSPQGERG